MTMTACTCECNQGGFCGGCGHAGCGLRTRPQHNPDRRCRHGLLATEHCEQCIVEGVVTAPRPIPSMGGYTDGETQAIPVERFAARKRRRETRHDQRDRVPLPQGSKALVYYSVQGDLHTALVPRDEDVVKHLAALHKVQPDDIRVRYQR